MAVVAKRTQRTGLEVHDHEKCHLLNLPPEVRNRIFDYVFISDHDPECYVDIITACLPGKALLTACRQIYDEASQMYRAKYRAFWAETKFDLSIIKRNSLGEIIKSVDEARAFVEIMDEQAIACITSMSITSRCVSAPWKQCPNDGIAKTFFNDKLWQNTDHCRLASPFLVPLTCGSADRDSTDWTRLSFRLPNVGKLLWAETEGQVRELKEALGIGDHLRREDLIVLLAYYG